MMQLTPVVKQLLIINVMIFIGAMLIPALNELFPLFYFENPHFGIWQIITHMFMHGNFMHIAFNMFALVSFGTILERFWGGRKFLFFYFSCGLGALLLHTSVNYFYFHEGLNSLLSLGFSKTDVLTVFQNGHGPSSIMQYINAPDYRNMVSAYRDPVLGASGAIYGLLVAFGFLLPNAELFIFFIPIPLKAKYVIPALIAFDIYSGFSGSELMGANIAHFAHVGGAITGLITVYFWKKNEFNNKRWN